jgi:hypothetical protein
VTLQVEHCHRVATEENFAERWTGGIHLLLGGNATATEQVS